MSASESHSSNKLDYDVVVVGGGPAGCTFVRRLIALKSSLRVLLIDKDRFPRDKVCGDGLSYQAIPAVRKVFPELASLTPSASFTDQQILVYPQGQSFFRKRQALDVIPRLEFDNALWQATVNAGAQTLENARVSGLLTDEKGVRGVRLQEANTVREISCKLVVGADGSRSTVRQATGSTADDYVIHALRQYVRGVPDSTQGLIFFFDLEYRGYFWIFPFVRDGQRWANIGYGNSTDNRVLKDRFWHYLKLTEVQKYLGDAKLEGPLTGFPLNMAKFRWSGRLTRKLWGPGYLLLGDAAALIHPLSGEGIAFGIESGALAAEVLHDNRIPEKRKGAVYENRVLRRVRPTFLSPVAYCAIRLPMLLPRWLSDALVAAAAFARKILNFSRTRSSPPDIDRIEQRDLPHLILLAGAILSGLLLAISGFWILRVFGVTALPPIYTVRVHAFIAIGVSFCLLDAIGRYGWPFASLFLTCAVLGSGVVEFLGTTTGKIFGTYHYNAALSARLFGVLPIVVPLGWFIFSYLAFATAHELFPKSVRLPVRALIGVALLVAYDLASDPNQVYRGVWTFSGGGIYYGVPLQNFLAWALFGLIAMLMFESIYRRKAIAEDDFSLPSLPMVAYVAIVTHEGLFGLFISQRPIAAAIAFLAGGTVLAAWSCRHSRERLTR